MIPVSWARWLYPAFFVMCAAGVGIQVVMWLSSASWPRRLAVILALPLIVDGLVEHRRWVRNEYLKKRAAAWAAEGRCRNCGYPRRGNASEHCPECGCISDELPLRARTPVRRGTPAAMLLLRISCLAAFAAAIYLIFDEYVRPNSGGARIAGMLGVLVGGVVWLRATWSVVKECRTGLARRRRAAENRAPAGDIAGCDAEQMTGDPH